MGRAPILELTWRLPGSWELEPVRSMPTAASSSLLDRGGGPRWPGAQSPACLPACQPAARKHQGQVEHVGGIPPRLCGRGVGSQRGEGPCSRSHSWDEIQAGLEPGPGLCNAPQVGPSVPGPCASSHQQAGPAEPVTLGPQTQLVSLLGRVHHQALQPGSWRCPCLPGGVLPGI